MRSSTRAALVIGGAGIVGSGVCAALERAGYRVCVVDPDVAGGDPDSRLAACAEPGLARRTGPVDVAVVSLPARGAGRASGELRPSAVAAATLPARLDALELALGTLVPGGTLIELAGGAALGAGADEAGLIAGWQRAVHRALATQGSVRSVLCAICTPVRPENGDQRDWPSNAAVGARVLEIVAARDRSGLCQISGPDCGLAWVGGTA